jgi:hypothetical protein
LWSNSQPEILYALPHEVGRIVAGEFAYQHLAVVFVVEPGPPCSSSATSS